MSFPGREVLLVNELRARKPIRCAMVRIVVLVGVYDTLTATLRRANSATAPAPVLLSRGLPRHPKTDR